MKARSGAHDRRPFAEPMVVVAIGHHFHPGHETRAEWSLDIIVDRDL